MILFPSPLSEHYISKAEAPTKTLAEYSVLELIDYYSSIYRQDPVLLKKVAWCESQYEKDLPGDGGRAYSVFQIHKPTFEQWSKEMGELLDYGNYQDHIKVATWAFAQGEEYRKKWTTYVAIKNGGTYSFYSKLLKKHFTVFCKL